MDRDRRRILRGRTYLDEGDALKAAGLEDE